MKDENLLQVVVNAIKSFSDDQKSVFSSIIRGEVPCVSNMDPFAPVPSELSSESIKSRVYFLDASGRTRKHSRFLLSLHF